MRMRPVPPRARPDRRRIPLTALLLAAAFPLAGCATETRVVYDGWGRFKEMGDAKPTAAGGEAGAAQSYTIFLERFVGADRLKKAQALSQQLAAKGLPEVQVQDSAGFTTVTVGKFADAGSRDAQRLLRKVRTVEFDGNRLYASANFVASEGGRKIYDPLDIRQYAGHHTLQIGFYDKNFEGDYKAAAEEAARALREEGTPAYFYHGPHRSLLCVGLFDDSDFEAANDPAGGGFTVRRYGPRIREMQEKFPYNLGNGVTLIEKNKDTGEVIGEQESCLVRVM